jgi:hypothetical protein
VGSFAFSGFLRHTSHLDLNLDVTFTFLAFSVFFAFVFATIFFIFHRLLSLGYFIGLLVLAYFIDLLPLHFHLRLDRLFGEFLSLRQSPLILADLAQYADPLAVPGRIRSPPSAALPACPNFTVLLRPVAGLVTTFLNRFCIMVQLDIRIQKQG